MYNVLKETFIKFESQIFGEHSGNLADELLPLFLGSAKNPNFFQRTSKHFSNIWIGSQDM